MAWSFYNSSGQLIDGVLDGSVTAAKIADGAIANADINASAGIAFSKMENLTNSRLLVSDGSGDVSVSAVTAAEIAQLSGLSANVTDTNLNALTAGSGNTSLHSHASSVVFTGVKATATSAQTITTGGNRTIGYHSTTTNNTTAFAFDSGYTGFDNGASSNETKLWRDEAGNNGGGIPWRSVLHVPVSGYYLISGSVGATNQGAGYYRIQFYNEAGQGFMQSRFEAFGDSDNVIQASCVAYLTGNTNGSNWLYMTLYQNSGSDMSVQPYASTGGTHFSLVKLG